MALISCPKCERQISDKAKQCPGCGWDFDLERNNIQEVKNEIIQEKKSNTVDNNRAVVVEEKIPNTNYMYYEKRKNQPLGLLAMVVSVICLIMVFMMFMSMKNLNNQITELVQANSKENIAEVIENTEDIIDSTDGIDDNEKVQDETMNQEENTSINEAQVGNLEVSTIERVEGGAIYCLTDAAVMEKNDDGTVKVAVKGEVKSSGKYENLGVYFKFLDSNGFELKQEHVYINGTVGEFTESFTNIPSNVHSVGIN